MILPGRATAEGTARYFTRLQRTFSHYVDAAWTLQPPLLPFKVSRVGAGTYRAHRDRREHHEALREAFISGINIVDTAPNHSDGAAEVLVGNVLRELTESRRLFRDEIVVVERAGFIEDSTLHLLRGRLPSDTIVLSQRLAHCLHPDFLSMQMEWSLNRLGLETIDLFLLQNPELQMENEERFFKQMQDSLQFLEEQRRKGLIQFYGLSSHVLPSQLGLHMLHRLLAVAPPGFRALQFPANIVETGYRRCALPALARKKGLFTMGCRPLNAMNGKGMLRLSRMIDAVPDGEQNPEARQMRIEEELLSLEERMLDQINEKEQRLNFDVRLPSVYRTLLHYRQRILDLENVLPLIDALSVPIQRTVSALKAGLERSSDPEKGRLLFERYLRLVHSALGFLSVYADFRHHCAMEPLERNLQQMVSSTDPLSVLAVQGPLADDMDTVFVGMRSAKAVRQIVRLFGHHSFSKIPEIKESLLPEAFGL